MVKESILFGVIVGPTTDTRIAFKCIKSISEAIDHAESLVTGPEDSVRGPGLDIAVCGSAEKLTELERMVNEDGDCRDFDPLYYDETVKQAWITNKKNHLISHHGTHYDLCCIVHDYYAFEKKFITHFYEWRNEKGNDRYQLFQPKIMTREGTRHSDWLVSQRYVIAVLQRHDDLLQLHNNIVSPGEQPQYVCGLPYDIKDMTHIQYISGGLMFGETKVFEVIPLDENRAWGQEEDIEWSMRVAGARIKLGMIDSTEYYVKLQKPNKWNLKQMPQETLDKLREYFKTLPVKERYYY